MRTCIAFVVALLFFQCASAQQVSNADAHEAVVKLSDLLTNQYPFPEISAQYKATLLKNDAAGKYNGLTEAQLAEKITADLQKTHKDVHLHVFRDESRFERATTHAKHDNAEANEQEGYRRANYGFKNVDIDPVTSTAYVNVPGPFLGSQEAFEAAAAAMNMAAYSKHVIIDLRANGGGTGQMGRFLASYFYNAGDEKFYLNGFYKDRSHDEQEWTYSYVPGRRNPDAKVYLLVGRGTGSAAEGFAYALQKLKRATIVGDTTAGAGIAGTFMELKANLMVFLPFKMVVAPNSLVGWEGTGVIPDIETGKEDAKTVTAKLILHEIAQDKAGTPEGDAAQWQLDDSLLLNPAVVNVAEKYAALVSVYNENKASIIIDKDGLKWNRMEPGKPVQSCIMKELKNNVLTIINLNGNIGVNNSRLYVELDEAGHVKSLTRKTLLTNGTIYVSDVVAVKK